tara:strand:+ start:1372 stop:1998 length:627 start_codon:yes stop_codon:yes gene_type:complete
MNKPINVIKDFVNELESDSIPIKDFVNALKSHSIPIKEASDVLDVSIRTIYTYVNEGKLEKIKWKGTARIKTSGIKQMLNPILNTKIQQVETVDEKRIPMDEFFTIKCLNEKKRCVKTLKHFGFTYDKKADNWFASYPIVYLSFETNKMSEWKSADSGCIIEIGKGSGLYIPIGNFMDFLRFAIVDENQFLFYEETYPIKRNTNLDDV